MAVCSSCGAENRGEARYCDACGTAGDLTSAERGRKHLAELQA